MRREALARDRPAHDPDRGRPGGAGRDQIVLRIAHDRDFGGRDIRESGEGQNRVRIGLVPVAGIVGRDEFQQLIEP